MPHWSAVVFLALMAQAAWGAANADSEPPLCHKTFRALERCLQSDYGRLRDACAGEYSGLQKCLRTEWTHIDDARGYRRADGSFNRLRRCRHGLMLFNPLDWYIGRGLEVYGEWGEKKVDIWRRVVKVGQVAVEVGAHVGTLTLALSGLVGDKGRVVAFEPFYPSYAALAANVGLNSLQNVEIRQAVVADRVGKVLMNRESLVFGNNDFFNFGSMAFDALRVYNTSDDVERPSTANWDEYPVLPLDGLSLSRLDFIKVDAEAMELVVLQGAQKMIKKFKPLLFLEYRNPWEKDTHLLDFLTKKMRYECVLLRIPIWNVDNFRGHSEDIWGGATKLVSFNLLCKHRWWEYPDMDEDMLVLFETAVDTDIEGLRTTPTADPFETLALAASERTPNAASASTPTGRPGGAAREPTVDDLLSSAPLAPATPPRSDGRPSGSRPAPRREDVPRRGSGRPYEEMTLDELLDDVDGAKAPAPAKKKTLDEMSLDELLDATAAEGDGTEMSLDDLLGPEPARGDVGSTSGGSRAEELTLDELLGDIGAPKGSTAKANAASTTQMTLDELLGPAPDESDFPAYGDDLSLDELLKLDGLPPAKPTPTKPRAAATAKVSSPKAKAVSPIQEMTLDELLGPAPEESGSPAYDDGLSLDELLDLGGIPPSAPAPAKVQAARAGGAGTPKEGRRKAAPQEKSKKRKGPTRDDENVFPDLTLDELLGSASGQGPRDERTKADALEELSLDDLLALDDDPPSHKKKNKRKSAKKAEAKHKATEAEPQKKVAYAHELTLDEL